MKVIFDSKFRKIIKKRFHVSSLVNQQFSTRLKLFTENPNNRILRNHQLVGKMKGLFAISINGDIRAIYFLKDQNTAHFIDIGTHNQVYCGK